MLSSLRSKHELLMLVRKEQELTLRPRTALGERDGGNGKDENGHHSAHAEQSSVEAWAL